MDKAEKICEWFKDDQILNDSQKAHNFENFGKILIFIDEDGNRHLIFKKI